MLTYQLSSLLVKKRSGKTSAIWFSPLKLVFTRRPENWQNLKKYLGSYAYLIFYVVNLHCSDPQNDLEYTNNTLNHGIWLEVEVSHE